MGNAYPYWMNRSLRSWLGTLLLTASAALTSLWAQSTFLLTSDRPEIFNYGPARLARVGAASITIDPAGNLYVPDSGMIRRISPDGMISPLKTPVPNQIGGGYKAITSDLQGNLYFYDTGAARVLRLTPGGVLDAMAAVPNLVLIAMAAGLSGEVYIVDIGRVWRLGSDGKLALIAGTGVLGFSGDGGPATEARIYAQGIAMDADGTVYLADTGNDRVRAIDRDGIMRTVAGVPRPLCVLPDGKGSLYVCSGSAILRVNEPRHSVETFAGNPAAGGYWGDGGPALGARFSNPSGLALDKAGNLYIADGIIRRVAADGIVTTFAGCVCDQDQSPVTWIPANSSGVARDAQGNVYFTSGNQVRRMGGDGMVAIVAGNGEPGFSGDGGAATAARLASPSAVATDAQGNLYIADSGNNRLRMVTPTGIIRTLAGDDGGTVIGHPDGVAVDAAANLYVSDTLGHRVRRFAPGGLFTTVAGTGAPGTGGDGGAATAAQLINPRGLAIDADGGLLIADSSARNVRKLMPDGTIRTLFSDPQGFSSPWIAVPDGHGGYYISDTGTYRVVRLDAQGKLETVSSEITLARGLSVSPDGTVYLSSGRGLSAISPSGASGVPLAPSIGSGSIVNAAGRIAGAVAPGEVISIYGSWLGPQVGVMASAGNGAVGTVLAGVRVLFDEIPAPVLYASAAQINAVAPFEIANRDHVAVRVEFNGASSNSSMLPVLAVAPAFFQAGGYSVYLAALNPDNSVNSTSHPARVGDVVALFATGGGLMSPALATGQIAGVDLSTVTAPVMATVGGVSAEVLYAGSAPGFVAGAMQVNLRIPEGAANSDVVVTIGDQSDRGQIIIAR